MSNQEQQHRKVKKDWVDECKIKSIYGDFHEVNLLREGRNDLWYEVIFKIDLPDDNPIYFRLEVEGHPEAVEIDLDDLEYSLKQVYPKVVQMAVWEDFYA